MDTNYKSQIGQDKEILKLLSYKKNGFFLDVGCADPLHISNTYVLEKDFNWTGICIDPRRGLKEKFKKYRTAIFEEAAIYTHNGKIVFSDLGLFAGINDKEITDKLTKNNSSIYEVNCLTFETLLKKYNAPTTIDYMSLDIEGAELLVLENFPFDQYKVLTASIEHNSHLGFKQKKKANEIIKIMEKNDFKLHKIIKFDFIFIHNELKRRNYFINFL